MCRYDVEQLCISLMYQYQHCVSLVPPSPSPGHKSHDNLMISTKMLSDSITRLRLFITGQDTFTSLSPADRATLYRHSVASLQILKAGINVDLSKCQNAFPLPYGENLAETEALQLIRAFELYNELRSLIADIQVGF